jgi:hypothetical protein
LIEGPRVISSICGATDTSSTVVAECVLKLPWLTYHWGMTRIKTGGRTAGTPNRRTQDLQDRLEALGVDPVMGLAQIANDPSAPIELRARVQMELLQYILPKRKALEVTSGAQPMISIRLGIGNSKFNQPQLEAPVVG